MTPLELSSLKLAATETGPPASRAAPRYEERFSMTSTALSIWTRSGSVASISDVSISQACMIPPDSELRHSASSSSAKSQ